MGTIWVKELTGGLDTRRMPEATPGGVMLRATDGHINSGGEFEKRAAFVPIYQLPPGTVGLAAEPTGLVVFGSGETPILPVGLDYQRLQHPTGNAQLVRMRSADMNAGRLYAVGEFSDGSRHHYYGGIHVPDAPAGTFVRTNGSKIYTTVGPALYFSGVAAPTGWTDVATGYGFIDFSNETSEAKELVAVSTYQAYVAIFAPNVTLIWYVDPDPTLNKKSQVLSNTGTEYPRSVTPFGDNDLFYAHQSGLRSLRARDASNAAATTDIGVPIDSLVTKAFRKLTGTSQVIGLINPADGRFWLIVKDQVFVFSFFQNAKVSAWSTYTLSTLHNGVERKFSADDAVVYNRRVYVRAGDTIYAYGGVKDELVYDETEAEAWLPYFDANKPTAAKEWQGIDAAVEGTWRVFAAMQPTNPDAQDKIATIYETTYNGPRIPFEHSCTHVSPRFRSVGEGPAKLSALVLHYQGGPDED